MLELGISTFSALYTRICIYPYGEYLLPLLGDPPRSSMGLAQTLQASYAIVSIPVSTRWSLTLSLKSIRSDLFSMNLFFNPSLRKLYDFWESLVRVERNWFGVEWVFRAEGSKPDQFMFGLPPVQGTSLPPRLDNPPILGFGGDGITRGCCTWEAAPCGVVIWEILPCC